MRAESVGVPYPANAWLYFRSRNIGAKNLTELLTEDLADCPDHLIVLLGLSQGAEVIRRTLATLTTDIVKRISAVVLLGDPTRHPGDLWTHGTTDLHPGIAVRYAAPIPEQLVTSTWGYALDGDEIAANHKGLRGLFAPVPTPTTSTTMTGSKIKPPPSSHRGYGAAAPDPPWVGAARST